MEERLRKRYARLDAYDAPQHREEIGRRIMRRFLGAGEDAEMEAAAPAD